MDADGLLEKDFVRLLVLFTYIYLLLYFCLPILSLYFISYNVAPFFLSWHCFNHLTFGFLLAMGGSMGLEEQQVLEVLIHWDPRLSGKLEAVMPKRGFSLEACLVGAWYLTCLSSSSIS